ncbi:histidine phosphotransferase family protein [Phaeobacter marinintestinus]|uniref:histidine phosphotransferase family protein n=1 Tax=Falsiphaeobacter marinintestinus TaxID=1492905 RepID=UPI0011B56DD2|nr:histidine phosphotransferase family protein [Phaeobacter marinintestinus]
MGDNRTNLAALIGSRICHDLISPIGAIANGLELLELTGAAEGPEFDLIADSAGNAGARIRFFRIAYGAAGDQSMGRTEICSVLNDVYRGTRVQALWGPLEPHPRAEVRLAFLALQCCETALPYGGQVQIRVEDDHWMVCGKGEMVSIDQNLWSKLDTADTAADLTPAVVQFALLPEVAADIGRRVSVTHSDTEVTLRF